MIELANYDFVFSTEHPNPWYHTLDFIAERITEEEYERLIELFAGYGLTED